MRAFMTFVALGTLATLAACGQGAETRTAPPAAAAEVTAPAPVAAVSSWPKRKPGLWTQTLHLSTPGFSHSFRFCVDADSDQALGFNAQTTDSRCEQKSMTRGPDGGWTVVASCDMGAAGKSDSTIHVAGDFDSRYDLDVVSTTTGAPQPAMNGERKVSMTAEWTGPCPAGWSGGEVETPGGRRINLITRKVSAG